MPRLFSKVKKGDPSKPPQQQEQFKDDGGLSSDSDSEEGNATKTKRRNDYAFGGDKDIIGIVMLNICSASNLPKLKGSGLRWDMDPFIVVSFGKKVFRTTVVKHQLNPTWNEKMLFHVRRYETKYSVQFGVLDWDKLSNNDHVGDASFEIQDLISSAPQPNPITGLYPESLGESETKEYKLPLISGKNQAVTGDPPTLLVRAKYQPYALLRQQFWHKYLAQYDTDSSESWSHLEITSMLDSLGSTLTHKTIHSFFSRYNKTPHKDDLSFFEIWSALETEIGTPMDQRRKVSDDEDIDSESPTPQTVFSVSDNKGVEISLDKLTFSGPPHIGDIDGEGYQAHPTEANQIPLLQNRVASEQLPADTYERVINIANCPLCHRPGMENKSEMEIITHMSVCASQDWTQVDQMLVGNFVTASQAQKKWYTNILAKVSGGDYKLGANSGNIIVQNRMTGQLEEEKMQVFVRMGIRLLYKGASNSMEGQRATRLLKSMSIKQGIKYDDPKSVSEIPSFIAFHRLDKNEILDPLDSFKSFNQFFYRKLKPEARLIEAPDDPYRMVSAADCRLMTFDTVSDATRLWIKGRQFSVARLLGDAYKDEATRYNNGSVVIFRLAPQDYHRFHTPVDGTIGKMVSIDGEYYTVNPQAIRSALDVYGENVRKIVPIDSPQFGKVMAVCIGAMMVGSIKTTVNTGDVVKKGDEFGYFAFGGSTIVMLFEPGRVEWDEDLTTNSRATLETLVRVGTGIGKGKKT